MLSTSLLMATMCLEHISQATLDLDFNKKKKDNTN